jgi:hypothetical protein
VGGGQVVVVVVVVVRGGVGGGGGVPHHTVRGERDGSNNLELLLARVERSHTHRHLDLCGDTTDEACFAASV